MVTTMRPYVRIRIGVNTYPDLSQVSRYRELARVWCGLVALPVKRRAGMSGPDLAEEERGLHPGLFPTAPLLDDGGEGAAIAARSQDLGEFVHLQNFFWRVTENYSHAERTPTLNVHTTEHKCAHVCACVLLVPTIGTSTPVSALCPLSTSPPDPLLRVCVSCSVGPCSSHYESSCLLCLHLSTSTTLILNA